MDLPKNITQIGEVGKNCKIYVEDYAVSYMKQLNKSAQDKDVTVALYGRRFEEDGIAYHFLYGACRLTSLQREVRHLSQAQLQEIERLRKKYFPELEFLGYRILNGEMIEGIHLCEQGICRYIGGYAQFYEKNDAMLAYMLEVRDAIQPEQVDCTKYEEVQKRQDARKTTGYVGELDKKQMQGEMEQPVLVSGLRRGGIGSANLQRMRLAAVGVFAVLCLVGIGTFREDELARSEEADALEVAVAPVADNLYEEQKETLLMEEALEQALLEENQFPVAAESTSTTEQEERVVEIQEVQPIQEARGEVIEPSQELMEDKDVTKVSQTEAGPVAYIIQPGDTLIAISLRQYGSDVRVGEICSLNNIKDPDDIKEGQVIMLPQ